MNKGGYPSAEDLGLDLPHRDEVFAKITELGEGTVFRHENLDLTDAQMTDFTQLRGIDYLHLGNGYMTAIVETVDLRRAPHVNALLTSIESSFSVTLRETGDRTAWRLGIKQWEPIRGYRYYTTGDSFLFTLGRMRIQFINAPEWVIDETVVSPTTLAFLDTYQDKEARRELTEWSKTQSTWMEVLQTSLRELEELHQEQSIQNNAPTIAEEADPVEVYDEPTTYFDYMACAAYLNDVINDRRAK
jgi:predicted RNA-binding protein with PUA-like domain